MSRRRLKHLTRRLAPIVERLTRHPWVRRFAPRLADPDLWHLNRRSTARAVAIGLAAGLVPGPFQVLAAVALSIALRANFPLAAITTLYTNPLTIVPLYLVAYRYGCLFFPEAAAVSALAPPALGFSAEHLAEVIHWVAALGKPLALGLPLLAATLAVTGFVGVRLAWRWHAIHAWRRRGRMRGRATA